MQISQQREGEVPLTSLAGVSLHELALRARLGELGRQPRQLWQHLVDEAHVGRKVVLVDVEGEEAADVAHPADYQHTWFLGHLG